MVRATWNGAVLAESDDTIVVEGNHYFPPDAVDVSRLEETAHQTVCPWKGQASYSTVVVDGEKNTNAAWHYPDPKPEAARLGITGYIAFWKGVQVQ